MDQQEQQLIDRIKQAQNVLVTVSANPSVDQLAAAIGLTVALNKQSKHGTAVFSGQVPSTIEFLKPEATLEKNTDSLRDFIIALDKSKADKLRYKVEDQVVRIFITPYRTSLSQNDLEFSQGDFNVDVVVALGVSNQQDIDVAITAHGRILHDATVASVSTVGQGDLGTINWVDPSASSLSEMMLSLIDGLDKKLLDNQIATALLTGIVASTDRFRNEKTSPRAMSASAELMAAGANQQLIATELETPPPMPVAVSVKEKPQSEGQGVSQRQAEPGELDIEHDQNEPPQLKEEAKKEEAVPEESTYQTPSPGPDLSVEPPKKPEPPRAQIHVDENGMLSHTPQEPLPTISQVHGVPTEDRTGESVTQEAHHERMTGLPSMGDVDMTANASPEELEEPTTEELTLPAVNAPLLTHNETVLPPSLNPLGPPVGPGGSFIPQPSLQSAPQNWQVPAVGMPAAPPSLVSPLPPAVPFTPPTPASPFVPASVAPAVLPASTSLTSGETLEEIEAAVRSPHAQPAVGSGDIVATDSLDDARSAVQAALNSSAVPSGAPTPIVALNAQPLGPELHPSTVTQAVSNGGFNEPTPGNTPADATLDMPLPSNPFGPGMQLPPVAPSSSFPGMPPQQTPGSDNIPPVPPPFVPPLQ